MKWIPAWFCLSDCFGCYVNCTYEYWLHELFMFYCIYVYRFQENDCFSFIINHSYYLSLCCQRLSSQLSWRCSGAFFCSVSVGRQTAWNNLSMIASCFALALVIFDLSFHWQYSVQGWVVGLWWLRCCWYWCVGPPIVLCLYFSYFFLVCCCCCCCCCWFPNGWTPRSSAFQGHWRSSSLNS